MKLLFNIFCRDMQAQLAFYQALLDLPESVHSRSPIFRAVESEHFQLGFHARQAYGLLGLREREPVDAGPRAVTGYPTFMLDGVDDIDRLAAKARALGGEVIQGPYPTYYGQWQAVLSDPEGHVIRIAAAGLPAGVKAPVLAVAGGSGD